MPDGPETLALAGAVRDPPGQYVPRATVHPLSELRRKGDVAAVVGIDHPDRLSERPGCRGDERILGRVVARRGCGRQPIGENRFSYRIL